MDSEIHYHPLGKSVCLDIPKHNVITLEDDATAVEAKRALLIRSFLKPKRKLSKNNF